MKIDTIKKLATFALIALCCVAVKAQSTNSVPTMWQSFFNLYNTNLDTFTNSSSIELKTGLSAQTTGQAGLQQEFEPLIWKHISGGGGEAGNLLIGAGANIDILGQNGGQGLDGAGIHGYLAYAKHNLEGYIGAGWFKDIDRQSQFIEIPLGFKVNVSEHVGLFATYNVGFNLNNARNNQSIQGRVVSGGSWSF